MEGGTHALVELLYMCLLPRVVVKDEGESSGRVVGGGCVGVWVVGVTHALVELLYMCLFPRVVVQDDPS